MEHTTLQPALEPRAPKQAPEAGTVPAEVFLLVLEELTRPQWRHFLESLRPCERGL